MGCGNGAFGALEWAKCKAVDMLILSFCQNLIKQRICKDPRKRFLGRMELSQIQKAEANQSPTRLNPRHITTPNIEAPHSIAPGRRCPWDVPKYFDLWTDRRMFVCCFYRIGWDVSHASWRHSRCTVHGCGLVFRRFAMVCGQPCQWPARFSKYSRIAWLKKYTRPSSSVYSVQLKGNGALKAYQSFSFDLCDLLFLDIRLLWVP